MPSSASVVFAGCARDCEPFLHGVLGNLGRFAAKFENTGFVFVENDSTDGTLALLQKWLAARPNSRLLSATGLAARQSVRTARIASARNAYMNYIARSSLREFDYLVVVDLDDVNAGKMPEDDLSAAITYLEEHADHAGLFACSDPVYFDVWALRHPTWCPNDVWEEVRACKDLPYEQAIERFVYSRQIHIAADAGPLLVQSAFGGLGIYRLAAVIAARYAGLTPAGTPCCEHTAFNATAAARGKLAIFPSLRNHAPSEHIRPPTVAGGGPAKIMRIVQDGRAAELTAPMDHPLDRLRAEYPLYDRWLPRLARIVGHAAASEPMIDVGANIGDSIAACRLAGCAAPFIAVEPSARYLAFLRANLTRNAASFGDVRVVNGFIGPRGVALVLKEANGTAVSTVAASGSGSAPTHTLSELVTGPVSLLKTDTDGFDAQILLDSRQFLDSAQPVVWAEVEVPTPQDEERWAEVLDGMSASHPFVCAFDNFGFPIASGLLRDKRGVILDLLGYIRRHRGARRESAGEPRIYYLDIAFFPERFQEAHKEFCAQLRVDNFAFERSAAKSSAPSRRLLVLTHHKCATKFLGHYLEKFCELNQLQLFHAHTGAARPQPDQNLSFLTNAQYAVIADAIDAPAIHVIRNPLDMVVSAYYSHRSTHDLAGWPQLQQQRSVLANCGKEQGLFLTLAFLELDEFYPGTPGPLHSLRHWRFDDARIQTVRMEDLVADVDAVFGNILVEKMSGAIKLPERGQFTFETMSGGRPAGEIDETSHYRSGLSGGWRLELPAPIVDYLRTHFRALLERYYPDTLS